jgi:hypothetical protein
MLRIKVNGAETNLIAKLRPDEGWDLRCLDPLVGEFRLRSGDVLHLWSDEAGEWLPASEGDLAVLAVREAERGRFAEAEFAGACDEYVRAARKFEKLDRVAKAQKGVPDNLCAWFDALEEQYKADKRLWLLFVGADRSRRSNLMYCEYRKMLLSGEKLRADA